MRKILKHSAFRSLIIGTQILFVAGFIFIGVRTQDDSSAQFAFPTSPNNTQLDPTSATYLQDLLKQYQSYPGGTPSSPTPTTPTPSPSPNPSPTPSNPAPSNGGNTSSRPVQSTTPAQSTQQYSTPAPVVSGSIAVPPKTSQQAVLLLDNKPVEANQIDTTKLSDGEHKITYLTKQSGPSATQSFIVDNNLPVWRHLANWAGQHWLLTLGVVLAIPATAFEFLLWFKPEIIQGWQQKLNHMFGMHQPLAAAGGVDVGNNIHYSYPEVVEPSEPTKPEQPSQTEVRGKTDNPTDSR